MRPLHKTPYCIAAIAALLFCFSTTYAQPVFPSLSEDARLFSSLQTAGTARIRGIGGAGLSLGGDMSAGILNPAGYGFYNRSSIALTPSFRSLRTTTNFNGSEVESSSSDFNLATFGLVISNTNDNATSSYRGGAFAVTYNQINTFDYTNSYRGADRDFSIIDDLAQRAAGISPSDFNAELDNGDIIDYPAAAYNNYLISPVDAQGSSYRGSLPVGVRSQPSGDSEASGRLSQWNFSYGGNFNDKLYLGASVGFMSFSQERQNIYNEIYIYPQDYVDFIDEGNFFFPAEDGNLSVDYVDRVQLSETQEIDGTGINANLGVIYRPIQELTVGLSFLTPTIFSVEERSFFDLTTNFIGLQTDSLAQFEEQANLLSQGNEGQFSYNITTPARLGLGATYFFQKYGFLTADVEYVNYPGYRFSSSENGSSDIISDTNLNVDRDYQSAFNYRVGGEFRYDIFRFRLGYAMYTDPTQFEDDTLNRNRQSFSGGVGVITSSFFTDLAVVYQDYNTDARIYGGGDFYSQTNNATNIMLTLGFNF